MSVENDSFADLDIDISTGSASVIIYTSEYSRQAARSFIVDDSLRDTLVHVTYVGLCGGIAVGGIVANILNIAVYWNQGFRESITVSLFALSLSDLCILTFFLWAAVCLAPGFARLSDTTAFISELHYVLGGSQRMLFTRLSVWVTVLIAAERCTAILKPHKVKRIFTPVRSLAAIAAFFCVLLLSNVPIFASVRVGTRVSPFTNSSRLSLYRTSQHARVSPITIVTAATLQLLSLLAILASNSALLITLRGRTRLWRTRFVASSVLLQQLQQQQDRQPTAATTSGLGNSATGSSQQTMFSTAQTQPADLSVPVASDSNTYSPLATAVGTDPQHLVSKAVTGYQYLKTLGARTGSPSNPATYHYTPSHGAFTSDPVVTTGRPAAPQLALPARQALSPKASLAVITAAKPSSSTASPRLRHIPQPSSAGNAAVTQNRRLAKMVVVLSGMVLVAFLPSLCLFFLGLSDPRFSMGGRYRNLGRSLWGFVAVLEALNASTNIFVYYHMSSRFKNTLRCLLGWNSRNNSSNSNGWRSRRNTANNSSSSSSIIRTGKTWFRGARVGVISEGEHPITRTPAGETP